MTPIDIIEAVRQVTYDTLPDQETWEDKQYLMMLNEARAFLYSKCPECRVTAAGGLTAYADIEEAAMGDAMPEDAVYKPFFVEYTAFRFFDSGSRDTANAQKARDHKTGYVQALSSLAGGR